MCKLINFNKLKTALFATAVFLCFAAQGQELTPVVLIFSKAEYHQDDQNWSVSCSPEGTMYFGNGNGLMSYDGLRWSLIPLPGQKIARSVLCDGDRIYIGSFEEFGYFTRDRKGDLVYTSLSARLADYRMNNDEIWTILRVGEDMLFHSFTSLFLYSPETDGIRAMKKDEFMESIGVTPWGQVLSSYGHVSTVDPATGTLSPLPDVPFSGRMVTVLPYDESTALIVTLADGLWLYDGSGMQRFATEADGILRECRLNRACVSEEGDFVLGSALDGILCIDRAGRLQWHINASDVLQGNTVLGLGLDEEGNIWTAMDSGISMVSEDDGIRYVHSISPFIGAIYSVYYREPLMYIGSNQGLFVAGYDARRGRLHDIRSIPEVKGTVWYIDDCDGQILCGTNGPTYEIGEGTVSVFPESGDGGSCMARGKIHGREVLIQGTYTELCAYVKVNGRWTFSHRIEGFMQPVSSIDIDFLGNIWAAHNHGGLFRISLTDDLRSVAGVDSYPSLVPGSEAARISVGRIMGRTVFSDRTAFYTYDDMTDGIIPYEALNRGLGRFSKAGGVRHYDGDSYWFITEEEAALASFVRADSIVIRSIVPYGIFSSRALGRGSGISTLPDGSSVIALYNSLAFIPAPADTLERDFSSSRLRLTGITMSDSRKESVRKADLDQAEFSIPYDCRLVTADYSCPLFSALHGVRFRYMLEGRDKVWTDVGESTSLDLSYLPEGRYRLHLEAMTSSYEPIDSIEVPIRIRPPYYRSTVAYIIYVIAILGFLGLIALTLVRNIQGQKRELEKQKLENELTAKSKEITVSTMNLIRKNELLRQLKEELTVQKKELGNVWPDRYFRKVINTIDAHLSSEEDWEMFEKNFDRIHTDFFHTLKTRYPELTASDLRFCSYLCLNLSSKEIASMMNISLKGVEAARYRIRKKIRLPSNESLTTFLMGIE